MKRIWLFAFVAMVAITAPVGARCDDLLVFAAASLKNALDDAAAQWQRETGKKATIAYGASSVLAKQIKSGAPAQVFFSADLDWMEYLAQRKLINPKTRINLLSNQIVLVAPKDANVSLTIGPNFPLAAALDSGRLAMANTDSVPAGKYGKAALEKLGVWSSLQNHVVQTLDVRAALTLVTRKEAPLGIVYRTDAAAEPAVKIVGIFPDDSHPPIVYPVALTADAKSFDAVSFLSFLRSAAARAAFERQGFIVLRQGEAS